MIHPAWSLTAAHCIPGNSWTARSAELLAALSVLGRNDVSNITEEDLENIGMTRLEADELAREGSVNFTGESFNFQIIFGLHDLKNPTNAKVSRLSHKYITTHPRFHNPSPYNNDIAIIKHKIPIRSSDFMKPVCLPTSNTCLPAGSTCVVTGWGNTDRLGGHRFPDRLQEAAVKILDKGFCKNPDPNNTAEPIKNKYYQKLYNDNMVCAGSADAFTDACQGTFIDYLFGNRFLC